MTTSTKKKKYVKKSISSETEETSQDILKSLSDITVLSISWYADEIDAVLYGEFPTAAEYSAKYSKLTYKNLLTVIDEISTSTQLVIILNESGLKTNYQNFKNYLDLHHPNILIKSMNVPLSFNADDILTRFISHLDNGYKEGKTILSLN